MCLIKGFEYEYYEYIDLTRFMRAEIQHTDTDISIIKRQFSFSSVLRQHRIKRTSFFKLCTRSRWDLFFLIDEHTFST